MKRVLLLVGFLPSLVLAVKDEVSAPAKMMAPAAAKAEGKPAPPTGKRILHLELKK